jgi:hypothetical protein
MGRIGLIGQKGVLRQDRKARQGKANKAHKDNMPAAEHIAEPPAD